jgi:hypothetical protein
MVETNTNCYLLSGSKKLTFFSSTYSLEVAFPPKKIPTAIKRQSRNWNLSTYKTLPSSPISKNLQYKENPSILDKTKIEIKINLNC